MDRRVRANRKGQRHNCDQGERRRLHQAAQGVWNGVDDEVEELHRNLAVNGEAGDQRKECKPDADGRTDVEMRAHALACTCPPRHPGAERGQAQPDR
jgi:hypothetical protein